MLRLLPGLYVAAVGLVLGLGVRRWLEPLPWRVVIAFLVLVLALFQPVLFAGQVLLPLDQLLGYPLYADLPAPAVHGNFLQQDLLTLILPAQAAVREAFEHGEWPLWNGRLGAGMPLLADPQSQALQPLVAVGLPLPLLAAVGVVAALRVFVALLGTWLFLRRLGVGEWPALAGAFSWGLGGFVMLWLGWPLANAAALLPVALWATARLVDHGRRRDVVLGSVTAAALLLAGQPEVVFYAVALVVAWALARAKVAGWRRLGAWAIAGALGLLVAAPALLPALHAARQSERAAMLAMRAAGGGTAAADGETGSWPGSLRARWLPLVAPNAFGNDRFLHYWGAENVNEDASGFVGTAAVLLALLGLLAPRAARLPGERLLQGAMVVALAVMVVPPGARPWLDALPPPLQSASYHHRLLLVVGFCLACLAACELERFASGRARRWPVVLVGGLLAAVITWAYLAHPHPADPQTLAVLREGFLRWQVRVLVATAAALLLLRGRWPLPGVAAGLLAFELLLAHLPANPAAPRALGLPQRSALTLLRDGLPPPARLGIVDEALPANLASLYGLSDVRSVNPMAPRSCAAALAPLARLTGEDLQQEVPRRLLALVGASAILGRPGTPPPPGWSEAPAGEGARVFLAAEPLPPVWLPAAARAWAGDAGDWPAWAAAAADPRRLSVVGVGPELPWRAATLPSLRWRLRPGRLSAELPAIGTVEEGGRRLLATSLCDDGGWALLADGVPHATTNVNGPFVGAWLPAGVRHVELLQRPRGFVAGSLAAAVGLATLLLVCLAPPAVGPRGHGSEVEGRRGRPLPDP
jgi:hypothetical protein